MALEIIPLKSNVRQFKRAEVSENPVKLMNGPPLDPHVEVRDRVGRFKADHRHADSFGWD